MFCFCMCPARYRPTSMPLSCCFACPVAVGAPSPLFASGVDGAVSSFSLFPRQPRPTPAAPPLSSPLSSPSACKPRRSLVPEALLGEGAHFLGLAHCTGAWTLVNSPLQSRKSLCLGSQRPGTFSNVTHRHQYLCLCSCGFVDYYRLGDGRKLSVWCLVEKYLGQGPWLAIALHPVFFQENTIRRKKYQTTMQRLEVGDRSKKNHHDNMTTRPA
jgi:hypothetical protein